MRSAWSSRSADPAEFGREVMVVEPGVVQARLGRERERVGRGPDRRDILVERFPPGVERREHAELTTPHDLGVELLRIALAVEGAGAVAARLSVSHDPRLTLAMNAHALR